MSVCILCYGYLLLIDFSPQQFPPLLLSSNFLLFFFLKFICLFREQGGAEREGENPKQVPHCQHRAQHGARTHKPPEPDLS